MLIRVFRGRDILREPPAETCVYRTSGASQRFARHQRFEQGVDHSMLETADVVLTANGERVQKKEVK